MNPARLMTIACTIDNPTEGAEDQYGDPVETTASTTTVCYYHQEQRDDITGDTDVLSERWTFYFPAATSINGRSTVTVDSVAYQVKGPPWAAVNPRTSVEEMVVATAVRTS